MKKRYTLMSATLLTTVAAFSQVEIRAVEGGQTTGNDISGTTVMIEVSDDDLIVKNFRVFSVNGVSQTLAMKRARLTEVAGWEDGLCWGPMPDTGFVGQCFPAEAMLTNPWTTPNAVALDENTIGSTIVDIKPNGAGCAHYRYYVMNGSTAVDSLDIQVCSTLSIEEPGQEPVGITVYPNPAHNTLNIGTTGLEGTFGLRITDVLGKIVYSEEAGSLQQIDVSNLRNGIYLVTVLDKGTVIRTRRVVVKHQ